MQSTEELIMEKLARAQGILNNEYHYNPDVYSGPIEAAESIYEEILVISPDSVDALVGKGFCLGYNPGKYEDALSFFNRAIEIKPEYAKPYYEAGWVSLRAGERFGDQGNTLLARSTKYFHQALDRNYSPLTDVFRGLGTVYFRLGKYPEAINWFKQAIDVLNDDDWVPDVFWLSAEAHRELSDYKEAISMYERYKMCGLPDDKVDVIINSLKRLEMNSK
jgi:tetratricopeptide (TPR) repeat protein